MLVVKSCQNVQPCNKGTPATIKPTQPRQKLEISCIDDYNEDGNTTNNSSGRCKKERHCLLIAAECSEREMVSRVSYLLHHGAFRILFPSTLTPHYSTQTIMRHIYCQNQKLKTNLVIIGVIVIGGLVFGRMCACVQLAID